MSSHSNTHAQSLYRKNIGDEGACAVAEALKGNTTLTTLKCIDILVPF